MISPEMQTPKLLWLKRNMPETWTKAHYFFDLPDFLVYKATGSDVRSACTTTRKWTYLCHDKTESEYSMGRWDDSYFRQISLEDLVDERYKRIGTRKRSVEEAVDPGLTHQAAKDLGLEQGTSVGVSIIDAHADSLKEQAQNKGCTVYELLNDRLETTAAEQSLSYTGLLTRHLHVLPYFHGNRFPRTNPSLTGMISGLKLSSSLDNHALMYLATIQAIAYGTRHIIETMNENGYSINRIMATGCSTKNELFLQEHAEVTGCQIILPKESETDIYKKDVLA